MKRLASILMCISRSLSLYTTAGKECRMSCAGQVWPGKEFGDSGEEMGRGVAGLHRQGAGYAGSKRTGCWLCGLVMIQEDRVLVRWQLCWIQAWLLPSASKNTSLLFMISSSCCLWRSSVMSRNSSDRLAKGRYFFTLKPFALAAREVHRIYSTGKKT